MIVSVPVDEAVVHAEVIGTGPDVLLVHGFPHTHRVWDPVARTLAGNRRAIAVDLRGVGASSRAVGGYDAATVSQDLLAVLDAVDSPAADVVAIDAGAPAALLLALDHPARVRTLTLMESTLGTLPGAEEFFGRGAPWWFGFHQEPGLAERVVAGSEADYLDFFYRAGTYDGRGIDPDIRAAFVSAYSGVEALRCAFSYYRAMPETDRQLRNAVDGGRRLRMPTMAVGAQPVGPVLARQLEGIADDLRVEQLPDCGHIIPLDRPEALIDLVQEFLLSPDRPGRAVLG